MKKMSVIDVCQADAPTMMALLHIRKESAHVLCLAWCSIVKVGALNRTRDYQACHRIVRSSVPLNVSVSPGCVIRSALFLCLIFFLYLIQSSRPASPAALVRYRRSRSSWRRFRCLPRSQTTLLERRCATLSALSVPSV